MYDVSVDAARCEGHARCLVFAPEDFDLDDDGYARVPEERRHVGEVSEQVRRAASNCPERAILVQELDRA